MYRIISTSPFELSNSEATKAVGQIPQDVINAAIHATAQTDTNGNFQLEHALTVGRSYSVVIYANGYELIAMDDGITVKKSGRWDLGDIKMVRQKR